MTHMFDHFIRDNYKTAPFSYVCLKKPTNKCTDRHLPSGWMRPVKTATVQTNSQGAKSADVRRTFWMRLLRHRLGNRKPRV